MKLYYAPASPYARKVLILLHETNQLDDVQIQDVAAKPTATPPELQASNPLGKIPALERGEGPTLYDSRVICEYLDQRANGGFYAGGWDSKILEATGDGIMDAALMMTYEKNLRPTDKQWPQWQDAQLGKVLSACKVLNGRWMGHLQGSPDIGHVAVACALAYVDFRHPDAGWRTGNDALAAWFAEFESRPSFAATKPA